MSKFPKRYDVWNHSISLSLLACETAVDLDNASSGRIADYSSTKKLAEILKNESQARYMPPCTSTVLYEALKDYQSVQDTKRPIGADNLLVQVRLVSQELEKAEELSAERLKILTNFCVALSRTTRDFHQEKCRRSLVA